MNRWQTQPQTNNNNTKTNNKNNPPPPPAATNKSNNKNPTNPTTNNSKASQNGKPAPPNSKTLGPNAAKNGSGVSPTPSRSTTPRLRDPKAGKVNWKGVTSLFNGSTFYKEKLKIYSGFFTPSTSFFRCHSQAKLAFTLVRFTQLASSFHYILIIFAYLKRNNLLHKKDQC